MPRYDTDTAVNHRLQRAWLPSGEHCTPQLMLMSCLELQIISLIFMMRSSHIYIYTRQPGFNELANEVVVRPKQTNYGFGSSRPDYTHSHLHQRSKPVPCFPTALLPIYLNPFLQHTYEKIKASLLCTGEKSPILQSLGLNAYSCHSWAETWPPCSLWVPSADWYQYSRWCRSACPCHHQSPWVCCHPLGQESHLLLWESPPEMGQKKQNTPNYRLRLFARAWFRTSITTEIHKNSFHKVSHPPLQWVNELTFLWNTEVP